jgi:nitrile hydratase subunit beta
MNGIHDLGGMHGFGAVARDDDAAFHAEWEARAFALTLAMGTWRRWNIDASRYAREQIAPVRYLNDTYFERWLDGLEHQLIESGLASRDELRSGRPQPGPPPDSSAIGATAVRQMLARRGSYARDGATAPAFTIGNRVRAANRHPATHTRLPRYVRGHVGDIVAYHGAHVFPDSNALYHGEQPQHLYSVRFAARELWGPDAAPRDSITVDLWEPYLHHDHA